MLKKMYVYIVIVLAAMLSLGVVFAAPLTVSPDKVVQGGNVNIALDSSIDCSTVTCTIQVLSGATAVLTDTTNTTPYSKDWDTTTASPGPYTVQVSGNFTTLTQAITVYPDAYQITVPATVSQAVNLKSEVQTVSSDFNITNTGNIISAGVIALPELTWSGDGLSESLSGISILPVSLNLGLGESTSPLGKITVSNIPAADDVEAFGKYTGTATISVGTAQIGTFVYELELRPENYNSKIEVNSIDVDDNKLFPGEETTVNVEVENKYSDQTISNIDITLKIPALDIEESASIDELSDGDSDSVDLTVKIPTDADADKYTLIILVTAENDDGDDISAYDVSEKITVEKDTHDLIVSEIKVSNGQPICGDTITARVKVVNIGKEKEEDLQLRLRNTELNLDKYLNFDKLDKADDTTKTFEFEIPRIPSGAYLLDATLTYRDADKQDNDAHLSLSKEIKVTCIGVTAPEPSEDTGIISGETTQTATPGKTASYKLTVKNAETLPVVYTIKASGYASWATSSIEPEQLVLASGQELPFYVYLTPNKDASGTKTALVSVYKESTLVDSITLTAELAEEGFVVTSLGEGITSGLGLSQNDVIAISMVVLGIIIVAALYAFGVKMPIKAKGKP